jgi:hypothetical protein
VIKYKTNNFLIQLIVIAAYGKIVLRYLRGGKTNPQMLQQPGNENHRKLHGLPILRGDTILPESLRQTDESEGVIWN